VALVTPFFAPQLLVGGFEADLFWPQISPITQIKEEA
jgi:hypothetical protein